MSQGDGGCIINISSTGALMALPMVVPYGSAKAALNAMSVSLSREYAPKVRVNTISPGPFLTDIAEAWAPRKRETHPAAPGRPGRPEPNGSGPCRDGVWQKVVLRVDVGG